MTNVDPTNSRGGDATAVTRYATSPAEYRSMDNESLRDRFVSSGLFEAGSIKLVYSHEDRMIVGGAMPTGVGPLELEAPPQAGAESLCERRELVLLNIGAPGSVEVDGARYDVGHRDCVYVGRGAKRILLYSESGAARFFIASAPAHEALPTVLIRGDEVITARAGAKETANERTIAKYVHEGGVRSAQLVLGITSLDPGNVWNAMPPHLHERRTEMYLYFDLADDARVFHTMGVPGETRTLPLANFDLVTSPSWSLHFGCGTTNYAFVWVMAGENQSFDDMQHQRVDHL